MNLVDLIGNTPLLPLPAIPDRPRIELWGKCEFMNPGGSVKDRPALQMIRHAIASGQLTHEHILIDATSGNTGIAYAMIGAALGYRIALVMPENVSAARQQIARAFGTELIFSSPLEGSDGAIRRVREIVAEAPKRYFYPDQYSNESNPLAHYLGTGAEILATLGDRITHFIAGIGTSGTVMGTGRRLKEHRRAIRVIAVEPDDALHGLEGLKHMPTSLVPAIWRPEECVDEILPMATEEAWNAAECLSHQAGLLIGHSAGAAVAGAHRIAARLPPRETACIVCILPDRGERYLTLSRRE